MARSGHPADHAAPADWPVPSGTTRLVALGDPHGAVERVHRLLQQERDGRTLVVSVGDVVGYDSGERCSELVGLLEAAGVPSVVGNHEHWMASDGRMFLPGDTGDIRVSAEALEAVRAWPWDLRVMLAGLPVRVTHSIHDPGWSWVTDETAGALLELVAPERIACIGHSHRPALYRCGPDGTVAREPFHFAHEESLVWPIAPDHRYVLDCGSLARPEVNRRERSMDWGTYGVVDVAAGTVGLHRVR